MSKIAQELSAEGIFAVYKPLGITSQKAVQIVKRWAQEETENKKIKVGHAGTLDPLASGVLVVAVGREYTRELDKHVQEEKEYIAEITLGATSTTDDGEGVVSVSDSKDAPDACPPTCLPKYWRRQEPRRRRVKNVLDVSDVKDALKNFIGTIEQTPPAYSAVKVDGQEAYKRMRRGESVKLEPRTIEIKKIQCLSYEYPLLKIIVTCGKGTYIRSLARDIGASLGTGAYLSALERTRIGTYDATKSHALVEFAKEPLFTAQGVVESGKRQGKDLGFPTANIVLREVLPSGIYAGRVSFDQKTYEAALYIGPEQKIIEAHVLNFSNNLYGKEITMNGLLRIRESEEFTTKEKLIVQIGRDVRGVRQFFTSAPLEKL